MAEELLSTDPETVGPYRLLQRLGTGGMGQVYLARSPGGWLVAVKVIRPELVTEHGFRARFEREVAAARTVSGIFTAPVVDADPAGPHPWLATAYVPGPSLADAVAERGPLPPGVVLTLCAGLAEGLQAIHAAGLVHRDLKPSNVLLAVDGPRVIDFGISRSVDASMLTQSGMILGSPGFLSPEQAEGRATGTPSDVFSLGAVLTFAATGAGPFGDGTVAALVYRVVNSAPNLSGVPERLRPLLERCLAKDPAARPTAGELLAASGAGRQAPEWIQLPPPAGLPAGLPGGPGTRAEAIGTGGAPRTWTHVTPPGQAGAPGSTVRRGRRGRAALIGAAAAVIAAASAGTALALDGQQHTAGAPATPAASASAAVTSPPAGVNPAKGSPAVSRPVVSSPAGSRVTGVWLGGYVCNQGSTGLRLTITGPDDSLQAVFAFYPLAGNPGVATGSYELTGTYSAAGGLVLTPDHWISEPPGYQMVGLSAAAPTGDAMSGTVQGADCSTFSVAR